jgi:DNA-binding transcriptional ArsR family regulator
MATDRMKNFWPKKLWSGGWMLVSLAGCVAPAEEVGGASASAPAPVVEPAERIALPLASGARLLQWLDPDAVGATLVGARMELDADAIATLFGLPIQGARMLREIEMAEEGLQVIFGADLGQVFAPEVLAMLPPIGRGSTMVRALRAPRAEIEAALRDHEMEESLTEGFAVWAPTGAFPWKVVLLGEDALALVPRAEIGEIGPLTAARDLPPSTLRRELEQIAGAPDLMLEMVAQGPFLHTELSDDVGVVRLSVRRWQGGGIDGGVLLQALGDAGEGAAELRTRELVGESDRLRELARRVVFSAEPPMIVGRVQLSAEDAAALRRRPR